MLLQLVKSGHSLSEVLPGKHGAASDRGGVSGLLEFATPAWEFLRTLLVIRGA